MVPILLTLVFFTFSIMAYILMAPSAEQVAIWKRSSEIRRHTEAPMALEDGDLARPFSQRVLAPIFDRLYGSVLRFTPSQMKDSYRRRLHQAGRPMETAQFLGVKVLLAALGFVMGVLFSFGLMAGSGTLMQMLVVIAMTGLGSYAPDFWLSGEIAKRQKGLERALPEVMDLLSVSVEAGLGFDGAIQKVAEKFREPVASEFQGYLKEIKLGKARADALRALADRNSLPDLQTFVASIIQADQLGVSFAKVLRVQSDQLRVKRKQRAEEKAAKIPIKIMLPLVIFIFPTIFIVIMGPAVINVMKMFGSK
ncbi:MAG: type II secretion system F family protein [Symbiobacteriia bacterium]